MDLFLNLVLSFLFLVILLLMVGGICYFPCIVIKETLREAAFLRWIRQIKADRPDMGIEHFIRYFTLQNVPERIARKAHNFMSLNVAKTKNFPVRPVDSLAEVYNIGGPGGMPLENLIRDVAFRCDVLVQPSTLKTLPATVSDLVLLVADLHRTHERERDVRTLLRPAAAPCAPTDTLLRPAQGAGKTDTQTLLRPVEAESEGDDTGS